MNLVMPTKDTNVNVEDRTKADESKTVTLLLAGNDVVYYYFGKPDYENPASLMKTNYNPEGLRTMIVKRNSEVVRQIAELRLDRQMNKITEEQFRVQRKEIQDAKGGQVVVIKPMQESRYKNLVDVLDEMQICSINMYAIVDFTEGDQFLINNLLANGGATAQAAQ